MSLKIQKNKPFSDSFIKNLNLTSAMKIDIFFLFLLDYLGNPRRNIRIPFSVLTIAKAKCRPELSARYLVRKLFAEEVLIKSFQGNLARGVCALNLNTMNALQGLYQRRAERKIHSVCVYSEEREFLDLPH